MVAEIAPPPPPRDFGGHGDMGCPQCGGYLKPRGMVGRNVKSQCRSCGLDTVRERNNSFADLHRP